MSDARVKRMASPVGDLLVAADATGLLLCEFAGGRDVDRKTAAVAATSSDAAMLDRVRDELAAYFAGDLTRFTVPAPPLGTPFQQSVWNALLAIPFGETRSYAQQAIALGNPLAIRAVARANGANFRAIVVPCHRVIGANGTLVGFGGGLACKRWLLDHESHASPGRLDFGRLASDRALQIV